MTQRPRSRLTGAGRQLPDVSTRSRLLVVPTMALCRSALARVGRNMARHGPTSRLCVPCAASRRSALGGCLAPSDGRFGLRVRRMGTGSNASSATAPVQAESGAQQPVVGYIGLGFMGDGMASAIARSGFDMVVYTRSEGKAEGFARRMADTDGTGSVDTAVCPADVAAACDVVLTCLANEDAGEAVYHAPNGIVAGLRAAPTGGGRWGGEMRVVADHSTVSVEASLGYRRAVENAHARFLDAPISGTPQRALDGDLTLMLGGEAHVVEQVRPVLRALGSHIEHMGGAGAGASTKLVNQVLASIHAIAASEALAAARALGLHDIAQLLRVVETSSGNSLAFIRAASLLAEAEARAEKRQDGLEQIVASPTNVPLRLLHKDITLGVKSAARAMNQPPDRMAQVLPLASATAEVYAEAARLGWSEADLVTVLRIVERHAAGEPAHNRE